MRLDIVQKPSNTDLTGERQCEKCFIIYQDPDALSAGQALWLMLRNDPE